ncbi:Uncharacterized protein FWK35_00022900 [Aphis craccivora]|uniref:Uncharacterized protein n=1 Tax=Aphis craccivora TaxID=307492 RepID=A0A6G0Y2J4_APHCR|nr:Uncharacterized protein FWK35_00022900 [Aphis craccivora]
MYVHNSSDEHGERFRSRSRSPHRMVDILIGNERAPLRRVPGLRGHLIYADDVGYTYYVQNQQSTNRRLVLNTYKNIMH